MTTTKPSGLLLPIDETFYGEINPKDLERFLACAGEALRAFGFSRFKTLNADTESEQEFWGVGELTLEGIPLTVVTLEGNDAALHINWLDLLDSDSDEILNALKAA